MTGRECELSSGISTTEVSMIWNVEYWFILGSYMWGRQLDCELEGV